MSRPHIFHPDYVYRPLTDDQKAKLSRAQRKRLGIPGGFARVYGVHVPIEHADDVRRVAADAIRRTGVTEAGPAAVLLAKQRGWKLPDFSQADRKSEGVSRAYRCIDTPLPVVFRG